VAVLKAMIYNSTKKQGIIKYMISIDRNPFKFKLQMFLCYNTDEKTPDKVKQLVDLFCYSCLT